MNAPKVIDNDRDEITAVLDGKEIRGWSYSNEAERRARMLAAHEFCEGWYQRDRLESRNPKLNKAAIERLRETAEAERAVGDPKVAIALELLLEWHGSALAAA